MQIKAGERHRDWTGGPAMNSFEKIKGPRRKFNENIEKTLASALPSNSTPSEKIRDYSLFLNKAGKYPKIFEFFLIFYNCVF